MTIDLCFLIHLNLLLLQKANLKPDTFLHVHIPPEGQVLSPQGVSGKFAV